MRFCTIQVQLELNCPRGWGGIVNFDENYKLVEDTDMFRNGFVLVNTSRSFNQNLKQRKQFAKIGKKKKQELLHRNLHFTSVAS